MMGFSFCLSLLSPELCVWNDIYFSLWQHTVTAALTLCRADIPTGLTLMPLGRNQSRFCSMAPCSHGASSASQSPPCPAGEMQRALGPRWAPAAAQALPALILLPLCSFKCSHSHGFTYFYFPPFSLPFFPCPWEGWFPVSPPAAASLGSWVSVSWKSVWSALISVEKDLMGPGFWDHYLSFTFIKSVMRKFKIKGFVNWIPVLKEGTDQEISA